MRPLALPLLVGIVAAVQPAETQSTPQIERIDLGAMLGDAYDDSSASAVNHRGVVLGHAARWGRPTVVFTWHRDRGFRFVLEGYGATDINNRGQIVGRVGCSADGRECPNVGFLWSSSTGVRLFPDFLPEAINETGDITGFCYSRQTACARIGGRIRDIAPTNSRSFDINEDGVIAGSWWNAAIGRSVPFVWSAATGRRLLDSSGGYDGHAWAINDAGQVVGALINDSNFSVATRWRSIGRIVANYHHQTWAHSVNNIGWVVGDAETPDNGEGEGGSTRYAMLWRSGRVIPLPPSDDFTIGTAWEINNSGEIAGTQWINGSSAILWRVLD